MIVRARLPRDRWQPGVLEVLVEDFASGAAVVAGPFACYGKADNAEARRKGNPDRDPTKAFGDHPKGAYVVVGVQSSKTPAVTYGPYFLLLDPVGGQALTAKKNGREGLAIHGGAPGRDGALRPTFGCLRLSDVDVTRLVEALGDPVGVTYLCEELAS